MREDFKIVNSMDLDLLGHINNLVLSNDLTNHYRVIGEGKDGIVYDVEGYAVKTFKDSGLSKEDATFLHRLQGNSAFPILYAYSEDDSAQFMISEKIDGLTLHHNDGLIKASDAFDEQYYLALDHAQKVGLVPFDLHRNNMMLDAHGNLKIVDVGRFHETVNAYDSTMHCGLFSSFGKKIIKKIIHSSSSRKKHKHYPPGHGHYPPQPHHPYPPHRKHSYSSSDMKHRPYHPYPPHHNPYPGHGHRKHKHSSYSS